MIRSLWLSLSVATINPECLTSRRVPGLDVSPAITHQEALFEVQAPLGGGGLQHAGSRLSTATTVGVDVKADLDLIDG